MYKYTNLCHAASHGTVQGDINIGSVSVLQVAMNLHELMVFRGNLFFLLVNYLVNYCYSQYTI